MAISICYECRGKISTNVETCPHCGNKILPKLYDTSNVWKVNGVEYDLTPFVADFRSDRRYEAAEQSDQLLNELMNLTNCATAVSIALEIEGDNVIREFVGPTLDEMKTQAEHYKATCPKCPTCGSTNLREIGFGERSLSISLFGLRSKKFNKTFECNDCGYTW